MLHMQNVQILREIIAKLDQIDLQAVIDDEVAIMEEQSEVWEASDEAEEAKADISELEEIKDALDDYVVRLENLLPVRE